MNRSTFDIAVIGLGPAGSTFARLLDKKLKVIAFDKKDSSDDSFKKPCGGLLAPDAQKFFARFGLTLPSDVLASPQIFSVKTIDLKTDYVRHYQRSYTNMDRHLFDLWLQSLIPDNVEVHAPVSCSTITQTADGYEITVMEKGYKNVYHARNIVAADGANSLVRRTFFPKHNIKTYMSVQQWFNDEHSAPFYSCIFDNRLTDCYAWGLSKNSYFIFGGAFPVKNARDKFETMKQKLKAYDFKLDNPVKTEACMVLSPSAPWQLCTGKDGCFLIGEAAGFISPSSLEGLSYAFESAYILSRLFNQKENITARDYRKASFFLILKITLKMLKKPFIMGSFLRKIIMRSGISSLRIIKK